jgi:hypothetical protein
MAADSVLDQGVVFVETADNGMGFQEREGRLFRKRPANPIFK